MSKTISQTGINLITSFEGCRLTAYQDVAGVWTIGYGHTSGVYSGMTITQAQAIAYLESDLTTAENAVNNYVTVTINQNQFDALVSFTYNVGTGAFHTSTLLSLLNQGNYTGAANQFDRWVYSGGTVVQGLVNRRAAEKALFLGTPPSTSNNTIKAFQSWLNSHYSSGLSVDGVYGKLTKTAAIKAYQGILGVTQDGSFGPASKAAVIALQAGSSGNAVHIMQGVLYCRGYDPNGMDGSFGPGTTTAVRSFQSAFGLTVDGSAGPETMGTLYGNG